MQEIFLFHDINASFNRDKYISAYLSFLSKLFRAQMQICAHRRKNLTWENLRFLEIWCLSTPITSSCFEFRKKNLKIGIK